MTYRDLVPGEIPPELSDEFDEYLGMIVAFADGKLTPEQDAEMRERMRTDEKFRRVAEPIIQSCQRPAVMSNANVERILANVRHRVAMAEAFGEPDEYPRQPSHPPPRFVGERRSWYARRWPALAAAAVLLAAVTIPAGVWLQRRATFITVGAAQGVEALVHLPDSSRAQLEPGSRLRYRRMLGRYTTRQVQFEGTGRFATNTGSERFELWTTFARISAQDARFAVRVWPDRVEIAVEDGLVSVNPLDAKGQLTEAEAQVPFGITVQVAKPSSLDPAVDAGHNAKRITIDRSMRAVPTIPSLPGGRP